MCSGPTKPAAPACSPAFMDSGDTKKLAPLPPAESEAAAGLLELSANNDLASFKKAVEEGGLPINAPAPWYSRSFGPAFSADRRMGYEQRTPVMIAALYGSTAVLSYILGTKSIGVNSRCGDDGATALHCAVAGGSPASLDAVRILIDASADVDAVNAKGHRPGEVIAKQFSASMARDLEVLLKARCPRVSSPSKELDAKQGGEKKEYPPDLTLPDIKNGIYGTDEFRMYNFKVKPCSRAYSHDWTECPFVHPGENARRRDPRKYSYSCVPCPDFRKGSCLKGDSCEYAHGVFESWLHPAQYRTRLCKDETGCNRRVCFFAHNLEELRTVNPTIASVSGLVMPSARPATSLGVSSLDMAAALMMVQQTPGSPISPSASRSPSAWNMVQPPPLQLPGSRLKSSLSARDLDYDIDSMGFDGYPKMLLDEISSCSSPRSAWKITSLNANDLFASMDPCVLSRIQGAPVKHLPGAAGGGLQINQSLSQQLLSGYGGNLPSSPTVNTSSSFGLDHSMATPVMNSRQAAFSKRSQSFVDRGAIARHPSGRLSSPSDWGSPDGKLDWAIQGDELNKLKKSATFNSRSSGINNNGVKLPPLEEPDLTWVQHLVKDGPASPEPASPEPEIGRFGLDPNQQRLNLSWDQLYAEQEKMQLVA